MLKPGAFAVDTAASIYESNQQTSSLAPCFGIAGRLGEAAKGRQWLQLPLKPCEQSRFELCPVRFRQC